MGRPVDEGATLTDATYAYQLKCAAESRGLPLPIELVSSVGSTNSILKNRARLGAPHGTVLVADVQTAGRGRLGRPWVSPPGANVFLSVVLRPGVTVRRLPILCLAAALAVARASGETLQIKWPNDLLDASGRKVAGVLAEAETSPSGTVCLVVGVGINVNASPEGLPDASCLADTAPPPSRAQLVVDVIGELLGLVDTARSDAAAILSEWRLRSHTLGRRVVVGGHRGVAVDVDVDGALLIRDDAGEVHRVLAGDVSMIDGETTR